MKARTALHAAAVSLVLAFPLPSLAAFDAFLKIDGVDGESKDDKHKDQIEIASWSFGASTRTATSGQSASRVCLSEIALVKPVDKSSPLLLGAAMTGTRYKEAIFYVRKSGNERAQEFLVIKMTDVMVSSVSHTSTEGAVLYESLSLAFNMMTLSYKQQADDGSLLPAVQTTVSGKC
jgi:type VI secretion system secreted protein Hcp